MGNNMVDINSPEFEKRILEVMSKNGIAAVNTRFERLKDGWIRDKELQLEWGPTSGNKLDIKDAESLCHRIQARLPTLKELQSLVDYEKHDPAINTTFFGDTKSDWYWTSTKCAWNSSAAWCVDFDYGYVRDCYVVDVSYVRPVRPCQE